MTFNQIRERYEREMLAAQKSWSEYTATKEYDELGYNGFKGVRVDYAGIDECIIGALMTEFNLSKAQAGFIHGQAYADKHACYGDVIDEAERLAMILNEFKSIPGR